MKKGQIIELEITDLAFGGRGIAKHEDLVIFVDGTLPGQTVEAKISLKKRRHAQAKCLKVLKRSKDEVKTEFQNIPGAPWANLPIEVQQQHKQAQVFELFKKFADLNLTKVFDEYIQSPTLWHYRNKMEYSFGPTQESQDVDEKWVHSGFGLGSKKRGQFWLVENLDKDSGLFDKAFEDALPKIAQWCESIDPTPYNSRTNEGFWRGLMVRKSVHEDKLLVNIITSCHPELVSGSQAALITLLEKSIGDRLKGVYWTQSDDLGNAATKYKKRDLIYGEVLLTERVHDLDFQISIDSFFQTNVHSAQELYRKTVSYLNPDAAHILDLFCGTGTIGQIVASQRPKAKITGVEIVPAAVKDAKQNADRNGLTNIKFTAADVNKWLKEKPPAKGTTIILDPPRAGISPKALKKVIEATPTQIVYVSCNPATMARDTAILAESGYQLQKISLVDQFPHTSHVECVGSFVK